MSEPEEGYLLAKQQVAHNFGVAAGCYQQVSQLQEMVASRLIERLELFKLEPRRVMDLGSGPGMASAQMTKQFKKAIFFETDLSHTMLKLSSAQAPRFFSRRYRVCADAEKIGFGPDSFELVFSNLMLQWCNNLDLVFKEVHRVLRDNGLFIFSTFGPDTLKELRLSWQEVDQHVHVNAFVDMHDIGDALIRAGLENPVMEAETMTIEYDHVNQLMHDLKTLGAHNVNSGRRKTLTGKTRIKRMIEKYEKWRHAGKLPATYEVVYGHAWLPQSPRGVRVDAQTVAFPVSSLNTKSGQR